MKKLFSVLLLSTLSIVTVAQQPSGTPPAGETPTPTPKVAQEPDVKQLPKAPSATKEESAAPDYSHEPFVIQLFKLAVRFEKDGTGTRTLNTRVLVNTDLGVQQWGQLVFGYSSANEKVTIPYVHVRKPDGTVINASLDGIQDMTSPVLRQAPMYTDYREKHLTVPSLRPGDILEYSIVTTIEQPLAANQFWFEYDFEKDNIVLDEQLEVNVPKDKPLKLKNKPDSGPKIAADGDRKIYQWTHSNLKRTTAEERRKDWQKRRRDADYPAIQMTTFQSWEEVGKWYAGLQRDRMQPTPELRAKALELTKDKPSDLEKIRAIYDYVAPEFRYVSLSFGVGRYQPHAAADIFANRYGDCKDKHTLLSSMLEAIGIHADPVLIHSQRKLDEDIPSPNQFDHVISYVSVGKDHIWLDTTAEVAPFELLSYQIRGKKALLASLDGKARIIETPGLAPVPNEQNLDVDAKINEVGTLTANMHFLLRGDSELVFRAAFRSAPESNWKDLLSNVGGMHGDVTNIVVDPPANTHKPFEIRYTVAIPNWMAWSSSHPSFVVPIPHISLPGVDEEDEDQPDPVVLPGAPMDANFKLRLEVPAKYSVGMPLPAAIKRDYGSYKVTYANDKNIITAERALHITSRDIPKARLGDYAALKRILDSDQAQQIALESTSAAGPQLPEGLKADDLVAAGSAALQNRNFLAAIESLKRATELDPKNKWAWRGLGSAYLGLQQTNEAIAAFKMQLEVNPYDEYANNGIGFAYLQDRKFDEAAAAFRKQLEVNPLDATAHLTLANALLEQRKFTEAVPELEKAAQLKPRDAVLQAQLGRAYLEINEQQKALSAFDKAVEFDGTPIVWNNVAYELARHNIQLDRAQQYAESAVTEVSAELRNLDIEHLRIEDFGRVASISSYWDTLGWVHFRRGNMEQAEKYIRSAWVLNHHGESADHLGQIYEKMGERDRAIEMYAAALVVRDSYPEAREHLKSLVKNEKQADAAMKKANTDIVKLDDVSLGTGVKDKAQGDVAVVFSPGHLDGVKFLSGDDKLRELKSKMASVQYPVDFPDNTPTKLVRRGTVSCAPANGCTLSLQSPEAVTSAE